MVSIEELLEEMDEIFDKATVLPLSGGKAMVNADRVRELIDDIRLHLPQEIRQARAVAAERNDIIADARKEAESITRKAEDRARNMVAQEEIVRRATIQANEMIAQAQTKAREIRRGATDYAENMMRTTEDIISQKLTELRQARQNLRSTVRNDSGAAPQPAEVGADTANEAE
ncbi:MAG: ATPase [Clostridia bacterium]|nr:ATPase [Clostridia bacterium]